MSLILFRNSITWTYVLITHGNNQSNVIFIATKIDFSGLVVYVDYTTEDGCTSIEKFMLILDVLTSKLFSIYPNITFGISVLSWNKKFMRK